MDIAIDFKNSDLELKDGDLVVVKDEDCIKQQITTGLFILPADWFIDITKGINYFVDFRQEPRVLKAQIKDEIKEVEGVERIGKFKFDSTTTNWKVNAIVYTTNGQIEINSETPIGAKNGN